VRRHRSGHEGGFTLLEGLVVITLSALILATAMALVQERLLSARARIAAQQLAVHLRSARFAAVSQRSPTDVVISTGPESTYSYTDVRGKQHVIRLPEGVAIKSSDSPIRFESNGTVTGGATTVLEAELSGNRRDRWQIDTRPLGVPRLSHTLIGD